MSRDREQQLADPCACRPGRPCLLHWGAELTDRQRRLTAAKLLITYGPWSRPQVWSQA